MNQYEAMFLFDPTFAASFENCENEIRRIITRAEGEIVFCRKWEERRLAYKVKGRKRGTYVLVYFKAPPGKITALERNAFLSENVLRVLLLRADGVTPELMEKFATPRVADADAEEGEGGESGGERRWRRDEHRGSRGGPQGGGDRPHRHVEKEAVPGDEEPKTESVVSE